MSNPVPEFFIVGVQKAGTTTVAGLLSRHPRVHVSTPKEPMFFCCDDASVHRSEFLSGNNPPWLDFDWANDRDALLAEYARRCFGDGLVDAGSPRLRCDASTSYALSRKAAHRIAELRPDARIIFVLRDPVARAESAYWHLVRKGLTTSGFDDAVRFGGQNILEFGQYEDQIRRYRNLLGANQVRAVLYEDFIQDSGAVGRELTDFLGLSPLEDAGIADLHLNRSYYPRSLFLQKLAARVANRKGLLPVSTFIRDQERARAKDRPGADVQTSNQAARDEEAGQGGGGGGGFLKRTYRRLCMTDHKPAAINPRTRELLRTYYRRENAGLPELLGKDPFERWGWNE